MFVVSFSNFTELKFSLEDIAKTNIEKLSSRLKEEKYTVAEIIVKGFVVSEASGNKTLW